MSRILLVFLCLGLSARAEDRLVAVLPMDVSHASLDEAARVAFEEDVRTIAGEVLTPRGYTVLTGDTTLRILKENAVDPTKVCEADCALSAAQELKATLFVAGTIATTEGEQVAFVRLFESASGKQLGAARLEGTTMRELRKQFEAKAETFFAAVLGGVPTAAPVAPPPAPPRAPAAQTDLVPLALVGKLMRLCSDETGWWFCTDQQKLTENDFVRDYRDLTGAHDLDGYDHRRNGAYLWGGSALFVAGAATALYASRNYDRPCTQADLQDASGRLDCSSDVSGEYGKVLKPNATTTDPTTLVELSVGLGLTVSGMIFFGRGLFVASKDGEPIDHDLGRVDANHAIERYNDALLAKERARHAGAELRLAPMLSANGFGVAGTF